MDQHRKVLAIDGWSEMQIDSLTEKARLQDQLEQLHKTVSRLHALLLEYQELVKYARRYIQDARGITRTANEPKAQVMLSEKE